MKLKRAPRKARRRRNRKFTARPTSHDGLSVIERYGNRAGWTPDGRVAGRVGNSVIVCGDGYELSVVAGRGFHCLPCPEKHVAPDYRGPYCAVEAIMWSPPMYDFDVEPGIPLENVEVSVLRAFIELHGGFKRMQQNPRVPVARQEAVIVAEQRAAFDRAWPQRAWPRRGQLEAL